MVKRGPKKKFSEEEIKERRRKNSRDWKKNHKEQRSTYTKKWQKDNPDKIREIGIKYRKNNPEMARAKSLISGYRRNDKKYNRGECTLNAKWMVEHIINQPCHYCGENDWRKIGCDRIDNSKPHTPDNVVPCCFECNCKRGKKSYEEFMQLLTK